jgi:hypothetical protein
MQIATRRRATASELVKVLRMLPLDKQQRVVMENPEALGGSVTMLPRGGIPGNEPEFIQLDCEENIRKCLEFRYRHVLEPCGDSLMRFFVHINKPYRLLLLRLIMPIFDLNGEYEDILTYAWTSTEFPHQSRVSDLIEMFEKADQSKLMDGVDRQKFDQLPDEITVYRGLQDERAKRNGLSWTTKKEIAIWFATRWKSPNGRLCVAVIPKSKVYMYTESRNENEVVLNPKHLKKVRVMGVVDNGEMLRV